LSEFDCICVLCFIKNNHGAVDLFDKSVFPD
jgi:hypothetical protein